MMLPEILSEAIASNSCRFAFELLPPLKGDDINSIFRTIDSLKRFNPAYINVTYHRNDVKYIERPDGLLEKRFTSKRPGTVAIAAAIMARYGIEVVPHIICGGFSKYETEDALIDLNFLGIHNVLALRGDCASGEKFFKAEKDGHRYACDLVKQIRNMNCGVFADSEVEVSSPTNFSIGVAGYPEKHFESPNWENDIRFLKEKIDSGADYIVTQMFFDNDMFFRFRDRCVNAGINVPIIAGLKPFSSVNQLTMLPQIFNVNIPMALCRKVESCVGSSSKDVRQVGVEWAINQSMELKKQGVPVIHFYTMGKADNVEAIASAVF